MVDLPLTPEDVAHIVAILDGSGYDRLDVTTGRFRLRVARDGEGWTQEWDFGVADTHAAAEAAPAAIAETVPEGLAAIRSPIPGTFYRAPQPGAEPFVVEGDIVTTETVVGIVETMKLMNPVHAGAAGTIAAILADNASAVENGAILMHLAPQ